MGGSQIYSPLTGFGKNPCRPRKTAVNTSAKDPASAPARFQGECNRTPLGGRSPSSEPIAPRSRREHNPSGSRASEHTSKYLRSRVPPPQSAGHRGAETTGCSARRHHKSSSRRSSPRLQTNKRRRARRVWRRRWPRSWRLSSDSLARLSSHWSIIGTSVPVKAPKETCGSAFGLVDKGKVIMT